MMRGPRQAMSDGTLNGATTRPALVNRGVTSYER